MLPTSRRNDAHCLIIANSRAQVGLDQKPLSNARLHQQRAYTPMTVHLLYYDSFPDNSRFTSSIALNATKQQSLSPFTDCSRITVSLCLLSLCIASRRFLLQSSLASRFATIACSFNLFLFFCLFFFTFNESAFWGTITKEDIASVYQFIYVTDRMVIYALLSGPHTTHSIKCRFLYQFRLLPPSAL